MYSQPIQPQDSCSQANINQKRQQYHFQIRKRKLQQQFSKKRVQIAKANEQTFHIMSQVNRILELLSDSLRVTPENQFLGKVSVNQYRCNKIAHFLVFVAKQLVQLDINQVVFTQSLKSIVNQVHHIIDRFIAQPDEQCIEFLLEIYPIATNEMFMGLHHNIYCNKLVSSFIKQQLFRCFMGFMMGKNKSFFENRLTYLTIIQVALTVQPYLNEDSALIMINNLNQCYSLINLQYNHPQTDYQRQIQKIMAITKKMMQYQKFKFEFFKYRHISDVIKQKMIDQQCKDTCFQLIGVAISQKQNLDHLIKLQPLILVRLNDNLQNFVLKDSYSPSNLEQIKHLFFLFSNFVCSAQGAKYFFQNRFHQLVVFILDKASKFRNRQILMQAIYIFVNLISTQVHTIDRFANKFLCFLNDQKYQQFLYLAIQYKIATSLALQTIYKILITEKLPRLQVLKNLRIQRMLDQLYKSLKGQQDIKIIEQILALCQKFENSNLSDM